MTTDQKILAGGALLLTVVLSVLAFIAQPSKIIPPSPTTKSPLIATPTSYDFGKISLAKGNVATTFLVENNSSQPITVTKLHTSCMCTTARLSHEGHTEGPFGMQGHGNTIPNINVEIMPGQKADMEIIFDPAAHGPAGVGPIEREAYIETSRGITKVAFKARVIP